MRAEMTHETALTVLRHVIDAAEGAVSVVVVDSHGEVVASVAMSGAAGDTYLNAHRKAYTAARSDALTTRQLAEKVGTSPTELASFDPFFSFFLGGVAALRGEAACRRGRRQRPSGRARRGARDRRDQGGRARRTLVGAPPIRSRRLRANDERAQALPLGREVEADRQEHDRVEEHEDDAKR